MQENSVLTVFAALPVASLASAVAWYERVLGWVPDARPEPGIVDYYLAADGVPEHGTLQLHENASRAGGGMVTINVAQIAGVERALADAGVAFEVEDFPIDAETVSFVTVGTFEDLDGNAITVVQPHPRPE
jgi:catechol 2,3-dioxygenase-like lactoylglutathione lyase family enzyme